ncbi:hypothetical protein LTR84_006627 [Exophiala bonariae]|uniref:Major facilitator superfamily (MFS) profile domain-containing protein n=1 Tax=Exophiala bonariae TaxID=1690606 RepID=A0AAV9N0X9_9EURO|nr:hypothetical protein LTR84_006627 [Exophiala bonariae]
MSISAACLGPPVSQAADFWGRRWFVIVLSSFGCVGCIIVSRSNSIGMAIAGQGISALSQGAQPVIHAIASEILPRKHRPFAQASTNTAAFVGGILGLLVGGALTNNNPSGFRTFWYITAGLYGLSTIVVVILYHPPVRELQQKYTTREKLAQLDWIGYFLLITGLVLFSFSLTSAISVYAWKSAQILAPLIVGSLLLLAFAVYEWKFTRTGMLHHDLFTRGRNFAIAELCILAEGISFFAANNYFGFEAAVVYGQDQFHAGLYYTVSWWSAFIATWLTGIYCSRSKTVRLPTTLAFISFALFSALMASLTPSRGRANILGYAPFLGLGLGTALNTLVVVAQLSTPPELISITTGLMIATRSFGGTIALSIYTAVFSDQLTTELPAKVAAAAVPLGFDPSELGHLIGALTSGNATAIGLVPGISHEILQAAGMGIKEAYSLGFRYVWITAAAFSALAVVGATFLVDPKAEFNAHIDAPVETKEELGREGITEKLHHHNHGSHA